MAGEPSRTLLPIHPDVRRKKRCGVFAHGRTILKPRNSENSKSQQDRNYERSCGSWRNLFGGSRRKIAKKIAKNKRCYANTLRPCSRTLLKVMKGG